MAISKTQDLADLKRPDIHSEDSHVSEKHLTDSGLATVERWFDNRGWKILDYQRDVWNAYLNGESGLVHSPTGTGKSMAAWFGPILEALSIIQLVKTASASPIRVLWITPLRALAIDTERQLKLPLSELGLNWSVQSRTGDTSSTLRNQQRKKLPTALVTTPESLSLLLSYQDTAHQFDCLQCIIVDEWHELLGNKRGVQLQLCLAHLRNRIPALRTWGLSATLGNTQQAADVLFGPAKPGRLINGDTKKRYRIDSLLPDDITSFPWAGHLGLIMVKPVCKAIESADSTLLFTNTRSQAERWFEAVLRERPDWMGRIALHHGSLDSGIRRKVEAMLRDGQLLCVVATSSLDLGVDFSPVNQVIQIGSPKGVSRLLQRAGRSGHQPGIDSTVLCVPTHALELLETAAARRAALDGIREARIPQRLCLDVLIQHTVTLALAGGIQSSQVLAEARATYAFADLSDEDWQWLLDFLVQGGVALSAYPEYQRVDINDGLLTVSNRRIALRHRMAIGTISADSQMRVQFQRGGYLGMVEESFLSRLRPGDNFIFGGRTLELLRIKDMVAQVRLSRIKSSTVPRWQGGRMPLSTQLSAAVLKEFQLFESGTELSPEVSVISNLLILQAHWSALPGPNRLLIETTRSREGFSVFVYPFAGRLVHEGMAALVAWRLAQIRPMTFTVSANDYGFELLSRTDPEIDKPLVYRMFTTDGLIDDIKLAINATDMARRQFRDIARIAGLVFQGYPGSQKTVRQVQASSGLIYDVLCRHDPNNRLPAQALDEVLNAQFEIIRLRNSLASISQYEIVLTRPERLTPLAFPLWADRMASRVSTESWKERVEAMRNSLERAAELDSGNV